MTRRIRAWMRANPMGRDIVVAGFWLVLGLVFWQLGAYPLWRSIAIDAVRPWVFLVLLVGIAAAVTQRSKLPLLALAAGASVAAVDLLCGGSLGVLLALSDLVFAAVKYSSDRVLSVAWRYVLGVGVLFGVAFFIVRPDNPMVLVAALQLGLLVAVSALWGWSVRSEGERTRALLGEQHARETLVLRDRIAHDLHDLVANQIAVAALHIEAARLQGERHTGQLQLSLARAKAGTDEAHAQLRRLITVLTTVSSLGEQEPVSVAAVLLKVEGLLPLGRAVRWTSGTQDLVREMLAGAEAVTQRVAVRVLEELVMNAARHGSGDAVVAAEKSARSDRDQGTSATENLIITVTNDLVGDAENRSPSTGVGLRGAALLVHGVGGELVSERSVDGVWIAQFKIPVSGGRAVREPHRDQRGY